MREWVDNNCSGTAQLKLDTLLPPRLSILYPLDWFSSRGTSIIIFSGIIVYCYPIHVDFLLITPFSSLSRAIPCRQSAERLHIIKARLHFNHNFSIYNTFRSSGTALLWHSPVCCLCRAHRQLLITPEVYCWTASADSEHWTSSGRIELDDTSYCARSVFNINNTHGTLKVTACALAWFSLRVFLTSFFNRADRLYELEMTKQVNYINAA